ncbi:hypothetical protein FHG87_010953 [Trinorchestia longiramus]|nr:hypothetical protein FHG87_010953 [Trinorchestia longiramus]
MNGPVGVVSPCPRSLLHRTLHSRVPSFESSTPIGGPGSRPRMPLPNGVPAMPRCNKIPSNPVREAFKTPHYSKCSKGSSAVEKTQKGDPVMNLDEPKSSCWSSLSPIVPSAGDSASALNDTAVLMNIRNAKVITVMCDEVITVMCDEVITVMCDEVITVMCDEVITVMCDEVITVMCDEVITVMCDVQVETRALAVVEADTHVLTSSQRPSAGPEGTFESHNERTRLPSFTEVSFSDLTATTCFRRQQQSDERQRPVSRDLYSAGCDALLSVSSNLDNATYIGYDPVIIGRNPSKNDYNPTKNDYSSIKNHRNPSINDNSSVKNGPSQNKGSNPTKNNHIEAEVEHNSHKNTLERPASVSDYQDVEEDGRAPVGALQETMAQTASSSDTSLGTSCSQLQQELEDLLQQLEDMIPAAGVTAASRCEGVVVAAAEVGDCLAEYVNAVPSQPPATSASRQ